MHFPDGFKLPLRGDSSFSSSYPRGGAPGFIKLPLRGGHPYYRLVLIPEIKFKLLLQIDSRFHIDRGPGQRPERAAYHCPGQRPGNMKDCGSVAPWKGSLIFGLNMHFHDGFKLPLRGDSSFSLSYPRGGALGFIELPLRGGHLWYRLALVPGFRFNLPLQGDSSCSLSYPRGGAPCFIESPLRGGHLWYRLALVPGFRFNLPLQDDSSCSWSYPRGGAPGFIELPLRGGHP